MIAEMKREILLPLLVLCLCQAGMAQYFAVSGNCELPGQAVVVSGMSQSGTKPLSGGALTTGSGSDGVVPTVQGDSISGGKQHSVGNWKRVRRCYRDGSRQPVHGKHGWLLDILRSSGLL